MIGNIINLLFKSLLFGSVICVVYALYIINFTNLKKYKDRLPFPFESAFKILSELPAFSTFLDYLQRSFFLIYVDRVKSELISSIIVTLIVPIIILLYGTVSAFCPVWYLNVATLLLCIIIPFYMIKAYVNKRVLYSRIDLLNSYTTITSLINGNSVMSILNEVIGSTYGNTKKIYLEFARLYPVDKQEAYDFLKYVSGDSYSHSVIDSLMAYDYDGKDTMQEINEKCRQGLQIFNLQKSGFTSFLDLKLSSIAMTIACIGFIFAGKYLADAMKFVYSENIGYLCVLIAITAIGLTFVFESN